MKPKDCIDKVEALNKQIADCKALIELYETKKEYLERTCISFKC